MAAPDLVASNLRAAALAPPCKERRAFPRELSRATTALAEASADFLASTLGMLAVCSFCASPPIAALPYPFTRGVAAISTLYGLLVMLIMYMDGGYRGASGMLRIQETERAIRISVQSFALLLIFSALLGQGLPILVIPIAIIVNPVLLILEKQIVFAICSKLQRRDDRVCRVVIYGSGQAGRSVASTLLDSPRLGFQPAAVIDDHPAQFGRALSALGYRNRKAVAIRPGPITPALLHSLGCDLLLVATQDLSPYELGAARDAADQADSHIAFLREPRVQNHRVQQLNLDELEFTTNIERRDSRLYAGAKRITDVVVAFTLLILLAPLFLLIAILIRLDSPGPALFIQRRAGRNGELFEMFKFRSMFADAPKYSFSPSSSSDPRITRVGRFLRRMNLDELPQLLNVLLGTMSLVGPRPEMPFIVERYSAKHRERLQVIPGITGLWQLSVDRAFPIHQNIEYDLYYIRNRGFFFDLAILAHTLMFAMSGGI